MMAVAEEGQLVAQVVAAAVGIEVQPPGSRLHGHDGLGGGAEGVLVGSQFEKIITTNIKWPNGLTIDFEQDKLYWADAYYDKIETCDFDGNYRYEKLLTKAKQKAIIYFSCILLF